jgi:hypothetical protein
MNLERVAGHAEQAEDRSGAAAVVITVPFSARMCDDDEAGATWAYPNASRMGTSDSHN